MAAERQSASMENFSHIWNQISSVLQFELTKLEGSSVTIGTLLELVILFGLLIYCTPKLNAAIVKWIHSTFSIKHDLRKPIVRLSRAALFLLGFGIILQLTGIGPWAMAELSRLYHLVQSTVDLHLFKLGHTQITLLAVLYVLTLSWLLVRSTSQMRGFVASRVLGRTNMDLGLRQSIGSVVHYLTLFVGFVILLQTAGIDLSALTVILGALGIGMSFGLQTITNNFVSGLIILFERPIKIGDRVQIGEITGEVVDISLRATTIVAHEGMTVFVPNSQFVTSNVINWTHSGRTVGLKFPITVSSKADPRAVQQSILEAVTRCRGVLKTPAPSVLLDEIAGDSMKFSIRAWTKDFLNSPDTLRSDLNFEITEQLKGAGVEASLAA